MGKFYCTVGNKWCKLLRKGTCKVAESDLGSISKCPRIAQIETTTLYNLLRVVSFERVFSRICSLFESQIGSRDGYERAFNELLTLSQETHHLNDLFIKVDLLNDEGREYIVVYGIDAKDKDKQYGLELCEWSHWLTMFIDGETLNSLSRVDIVAGCLYEMTFFGFSSKKVRHYTNINQKIITHA